MHGFVALPKLVSTSSNSGKPVTYYMHSISGYQVPVSNNHMTKHKPITVLSTK